jgi:flagellar motor protein MotB
MSINLRAVLGGLISSTLLISVGCGPSKSVNPWALRKENAQLKSAVRQYQDQLAREKSRSENLDADNEELQTMLAEEKDARQLAQNDRGKFAAAPRPPEDFDDAGADIGRAPARTTNPDTRVASNSPDAGRGSLPMSNISGAQVIRDGDAVRIRVTNTSLFDPGKATLKPGASKTLDQVAGSIRRSYPGQLVGIEGHTDADPIKKSNWKDNHELSYQRARAVYEYLSSRGGIPANQLYVAAYGPNYPVADNRSSAGKAQNRRVEFVVRPDGGRVE